jgi:hypothetical protein
MFQKNVNKILETYKNTFSYLIELKYAKILKKNEKNLVVRTHDDFKLTNECNLMVIALYIKEIKRLKYFRSILFVGIFPEDETYSQQHLYGLVLALKECLKMKHIQRHKNSRDLKVLLF